MIKVPNRISVMLSTLMAAVLFVGCLVGAVFMPTLSNMLIEARDSISVRDDLTSNDRVFVLVIAYVILAVMLLADILLFCLLKNVRQQKIFTKCSVSVIRGVSWCCIGLCAVFSALGYYFYLSFIVAFLALFLGVCLRVVKNVIEEATEIKSENDLTV